MVSRSSYLGGATLGFVLALLATLVPTTGIVGLSDDSSLWLTLNLGHSVWFFAAVLIAYVANLSSLRLSLQSANPEYREVVQLDQLSDVWIHLFVGIGVVWTAIGMRSALSTTLSAPGSLHEEAGQVLSRLVDGGILLALTTTIVGAIGGYVMRLAKTCGLGAQLTEFYHHYERREIDAVLQQLKYIQAEVRALGTVLAKEERNIAPQT